MASFHERTNATETLDNYSHLWPSNEWPIVVAIGAGLLVDALERLGN